MSCVALEDSENPYFHNSPQFIVFIVIKVTGRACVGDVGNVLQRTNDYPDKRITKSRHRDICGIFDFAAHTAASIVIRGERRERAGGWQKRKAQWRVPRARDTRECVFSLVTVTCDALAPYIARPYEALAVRETYTRAIPAWREKHEREIGGYAPPPCGEKRDK